MNCGTAFVVDDDLSNRELVAALLERIGFATRSLGSGTETMLRSLEEEPQLVVLDVHMPDMSGYEVLRELRERFGPTLPIMFLSGERTESFDRTAGLLLGADDYMVKPFDPDELLARVLALVRRRPCEPLAAEAAEADVESPLTVREGQVLGLLARGIDQDGIAKRLVISPKTVSTHIQRVLTKLGVHSRAQAVVEAYRRGLVSDPDVAPPEAPPLQPEGVAHR